MTRPAPHTSMCSQLLAVEALNLEELMLQGNHIADGGVTALCGALLLPAVQPKPLRVLSLGSTTGGNAVGDAGAVALAQAFDALRLPAIEKLGLDYNSISDGGAEALLAALSKEPTSPKLRMFSISANRLSEPMVQALLKLSKARTFILLSRPQLSAETLTGGLEGMH